MPFHVRPGMLPPQCETVFFVSATQQAACSCSSVVEHFLGKEEVAGSIPATSSIRRIPILHPHTPTN